MTDLETALTHLAKKDKVMKLLVTQYKLEPIKPHSRIFRAFCRSIIGQQVSVKAANAIYKKFCDLFDRKPFPKPEEVLEKPIEVLRTSGVSGSKAKYIRSVAEHAIKGELNFRKLNKLSDEEIIQHLIKIKGVGRWTAEMSLMFMFGRPDVFSPDDQGIKVAMKRLYNLPDSVTKEALIKLATRWKPYRTTACRLLWASLDNQ